MKIKLFEATCYIQGKSTSSVAIGTGIKTFVLTKNVVFKVGMEVDVANPDSAGVVNTMVGTVVSYDSSTKSLRLNITSVTGSGTLTAWTIGGLYTFRWTTGRYFVTKVSETPSLAKYYNRVLNAGNLERFLFSSGTTFGEASIGIGIVSVSNADRTLDDLIDYNFDGQPFVIREGLETSAYPSGFTTLFYGTVKQTEFPWRSINFALEDRLGEVFNRPVQYARYLGTNSLPNGVEGVATDLLGKPKPIVKGFVENIAPPMVNSSKQTFQISAYQIYAINNVYHGGLAITAGNAHATLALLQAAVVASSTYDYYLGGGGDGCYIRIGSTVAKTVTVDVTESSSAANMTAAQIAKWFLQNPGLVDTGDLNAASITAVDSANSSVVGIYTGIEERNTGSCINELLQSVGASCYINRSGEFSMGILDVPTGSSIATLRSYQISDEGNGVQRVTPNDPNQGLAIPYAVLNYRKNYTLQNESDITAAAITRFGYAGKEYRSVVSALDNDVLTRSLLAVPVTFNSLLTVQSDAQTEVNRRGVIYNTRRDMVQIKISNNYIGGIDLNTIVLLDVSAYTWSGGKKFLVIGMNEDYTINQTILTLWG
jgi:hypothetical protein